jgi:hypothetical protein
MFVCCTCFLCGECAKKISRDYWKLVIPDNNTVHNIQGRFDYETPWRYIILPCNALKSPAVRHCYRSEEVLHSGITLSNFTFGWRYSEEKYFEYFQVILKSKKFRTSFRKKDLQKQTYKNSPQSGFCKFTLTCYHEILQTSYNTLTSNTLTTNTPVPS